MNKILFKGENISNSEGYKVFEQYTRGLKENADSTRENNDLITYVEFIKDENTDTKVIVEAYYKENNFNFEYLSITEVTLPDAVDFNNITTLRDKYIVNWTQIPESLQSFILNCDKYWIRLQEVLLYKDNKIIASIGIDRWYNDITIGSMGAGDLFQWNLQDGFTVNNLK